MIIRYKDYNSKDIFFTVLKDNRLFFAISSLINVDDYSIIIRLWLNLKDVWSAKSNQEMRTNIYTKIEP